MSISSFKQKHTQYYKKDIWHGRYSISRINTLNEKKISYYFKRGGANKEYWSIA